MPPLCFNALGVECLCGDNSAIMNRDTPLSYLAEWRRYLSVRRSQRAKHVRLKVHHSGQVEVVVPLRFDERRLPAILDAHEGWVQRTLQRVGATPAPLQRISAPQRIILPAIAREWRVEYQEPTGERSFCHQPEEGILKVSGGMRWQAVLKRWMVRQGKRHLVPWLDQVSAELELPYSGVTLRGQKSRWGSCSAKHHINLNYALLFLPPHCVRYLFVHELCHTVHLNHSPHYWALVASKEPDYRRLERELREASRLVPAWLHAVDIASAGKS